jgi:hypothetical protein
VLVVASLALTLASQLVAHVAGKGPFNPTISVSPSSGSPGVHVTITGSGFPPQTLVALYIDQPSPFLGAPGPRADAQGAFTMDLVWPDQRYDSAGKVNPAKPGVHNVCGNTNYGGGSQQDAAKACAQFVVVAIPASPAAQSPAPVASNSSWPGMAGVIGGVAVVIVLVAGAVVLMRRSG